MTSWVNTAGLDTAAECWRGWSCIHISVALSWWLAFCHAVAVAVTAQELRLSKLNSKILVYWPRLRHAPIFTWTNQSINQSVIHL